MKEHIKLFLECARALDKMRTDTKVFLFFVVAVYKSADIIIAVGSLLS